ncbi:hypothetical protein PDJAM_G00263090 [Pangasius djambal]|nr:hypothetical protein [Pangasius djambal]
MQMKVFKRKVFSLLCSCWILLNVGTGSWSKERSVTAARRWSALEQEEHAVRSALLPMMQCAVTDCAVTDVGMIREVWCVETL